MIEAARPSSRLVKQTQAHAFGLFVSGSRGNTPQPKLQATNHEEPWSQLTVVGQCLCPLNLGSLERWSHLKS